MILQRLILLALVLGLIGLAWRKNHGGPHQTGSPGAPAAAAMNPGR
jgi:hypothetical protein